MKEKERYEIADFELGEPSVMFDNKTQQIILTLENYCYNEIYKLVDLLNQQDEEIKELKQHSLNDKEWQDYCIYKRIEPQIKGCLDRENKLIKENQQLKQSQKELAISESDKLFYNLQGMKHTTNLTIIRSLYECIKGGKC